MIHKILDTKGNLKGMVIVCKYDPLNNQPFNPEIPKGVFAVYFNTFVNKKTGKDVINNVTRNHDAELKQKGIASTGKLWAKTSHLISDPWIEKTIKKSDEIFPTVTRADLEKEYQGPKSQPKSKKKSLDLADLNSLDQQQLVALLTKQLKAGNQ